MFAFGPTQRVLLSVSPVDFRQDIDGLAALCRRRMQEDPMNGTLFVFTNRSRSGLKLLFYDGQGFWLATKRFSQGNLRWWPTADTPAHPLAVRELTILLWNGYPQQTNWAPLWRPLPITPTVSAARHSMA